MLDVFENSLQTIDTHFFSSRSSESKVRHFSDPWIITPQPISTYLFIPLRHVDLQTPCSPSHVWPDLPRMRSRPASTSRRRNIKPAFRILGRLHIGRSTLRLPFPSPSHHPITNACPLEQQDTEPVGQGSICTTSCPSSSFIQTTSTTIRPGTYSAAINSALGGGSSDCAPCGSCYNIINAGVPYCDPDPYDPSCGAPSGSMVQGGPNNITVMITNHCTDCKSVSFSSTPWNMIIAF